MARMSSEYLKNVVASKGYVYVSGMQMFCKVVLIGATKYTRMRVQIYPKIQGYSFSYVNDHKMSWYRMGSSISCDCYSSALAHHDVSTVVQTLVEQTRLRVFVESVKYLDYEKASDKLCTTDCSHCIRTHVCVFYSYFP